MTATTGSIFEAAALVARVRAAGGDIRLAGDRPQVRGPVEPILHAALRAHRDDLIAFFRNGAPPPPRAPSRPGPDPRPRRRPGDERWPASRWTEPLRCWACGAAAWWVGAGVVRCGVCHPQSTSASREQCARILRRAERLGWSAVRVERRLTIAGAEGWQQWVSRLHERGAAWLLEELARMRRAAA